MLQRNNYSIRSRREIVYIKIELKFRIFYVRNFLTIEGRAKLRTS